MTIKLLKTKFKEALLCKDINEYKYLLQYAMQHIGHTDPVLRDQLILEYLFRMFIEGDMDIDELHHVTYELLENINSGISEISNLVFKRTFSMLAIVALIRRHKQSPWMSHQIQRDMIDDSLSAFSKEKDMRGYVPNKGWAHAGAHGADLFLAISKLDEVTKKDLLQMLDIIYSKLCHIDYSYNLNEDKRMAKAVSGIFEHHMIKTHDIEKWLNSFNHIEREGIQLIVAKNNSRNFLTALRVYMKHEEYIRNQCEEIVEKIIIDR